MARAEAPFTADYVIVGGGSAGAVVANRLSEDPKTSVVLIEAGGDARSFLVQFPVGFFNMLLREQYDWRYEQEPDPTLDGRSWIWSAGRMLGGGSSLNAQVYIRGTAHDFDQWKDMGAAGWGFHDVLPYFLRLEDWTGPASQARGSHGPLTVGPVRDPHPLCAAFLKGCAEIGLPTLADYNDGSDFGAFMTQTNQRDGWRCSTEKAYLRPIRKRPNLHIITEAEVETVQVVDGRATGVVLRRGGIDETIVANREVIVSAGTMGSPALLMRSGIGPAEELRNRGIVILHDAPEVGENLQEHSATAVAWGVNVPTINMETSRVALARNFAKFFWNRTGSMGSPVVQAMAFAKTRADLQFPDVQLHFLPLVQAVGDPSVKLRMGMPVCPGVTISMSLCKPKARGRVTLGDTLRPRILHQALGHPEDARTLMDGLDLVERLHDSSALASAVTDRLYPVAPLRTDEDKMEYLRKTLNITWHAVGTCRMGSDAQAVVDPQLRLRGVAGLRVVDASVMPTTTSGNTNAASIMIGEKAAEMIRRGA